MIKKRKKFNQISIKICIWDNDYKDVSEDLRNV